MPARAQDADVQVIEALATLGGVARADQLARLVTARAVAEAVAAGEVLSLSRGRYGLGSAPLAHRAAMGLSGSVAGLSAAVEHGWPVLRAPQCPWVCVPANRNLPLHRRRGVRVVYGSVDAAVTSPLRTVIDCGRRLPLVESLAIADSALRSGTVDHDELVAAASGLRGPGAGATAPMATEASALAANPLESALRAISLEVPGLRLVPQAALTLAGVTVHPDLYDERLGLVVEGEGWLYHGLPEQFARDLWRYTEMTVRGLMVARFGHQAVTLQQSWVRDCLESLARTGRGRRNCPSCA